MIARRPIEQLMFFADRNKTFFDPESFPWAASVEAEWERFGKSWMSFSPAEKRFRISRISPMRKTPDRRRPVEDVLALCLWQESRGNCSRCPETVRVLQKIPGMKSAMFSILAPRKHIQNTEDCGRVSFAITSG